MKNVLLIGEAMALFVATEYGELVDVTNFNKSISGAELNVSIGLKRLNHNPIMITKVGDDVLGHHINSFMKKEGLDTKYFIYDKKYNTGIQLKSKVKEGDSYAPYFRSYSAASFMNVCDIEKVDFSEIDFVHITGVALGISKMFRDTTIAIIKKAKTYKIPICFDPNLRSNLWSSEEKMIETINEVAKLVDYFLPGITEAEILTGLKSEDDIAEYYFRETNIKTIVIKKGAEGAYYNNRFKREVVPGFRVNKFVDTVGAGDGFAAGFISGVLDGCTIKESVIRANGVGAIQLSHWSDNEGLPTYDELKKFIEKH